jgi:hypothetical protein
LHCFCCAARRHILALSVGAYKTGKNPPRAPLINEGFDSVGRETRVREHHVA